MTAIITRSFGSMLEMVLLALSMPAAKAQNIYAADAVTSAFVDF